MQNADDFNGLFVAHSVKNDMAALGEFSVTIADVVTCLTGRGGIDQHMKGIIKLFDVEIALLFSPTFLSENRNASQIGFCLVA